MISLFVVGAVALFLVSSALAPIEALGWWAGWRGDARTPLRSGEFPPSDAPHFLVYLSGISAISGDAVSPEERRFLDHLRARLPGCAVVRDVFPYSVTNTALNGQRALAWFWTRIERLRVRYPRALPAQLLNLRNLFQVAVSADERYGPIFNYGVSQEIVEGLRRAGYRGDSGVPVTLLGWSGGAQIALGAAPFLALELGAPLRVVSIGGVMAADPGLDRVHRCWHLVGDRDRVQRLGALLSPGRWPGALASPWHRARMDGRLVEIPVGPMEHRFPGNYFDDRARLDGGQPLAERTLAAVVAVLEGVGAT
jgi:hypothetical protein